VTAAVAVAYQLLARVEQETDAAEPMPKMVVVFTDRTAASWDAARAEDLKTLRDAVPDPKPVHVVLDFGVDQPANVSILAAEMKPQVIAANQTANVAVTVGAVGSDRPLEVTVRAKLDGADKPDSKVAVVPPNQTRAVAFEFRGLAPGLHQVEFALAAADKLEFDNKRFLTFKVGESRRILTVTDDRPGAAFWQAAHVAREQFACIVVAPDQIKTGDRGTAVVLYAPDPKKPRELVSDDLRTFEVVCLLNVANPSDLNRERPNDGTLWDRLRPYARAGGKLLVIPGPDTTTSADGYNAATDLMPGKLGLPVVDTRKLNPPPPPQAAASWPAARDGANGVTWALDEKALKHPMLKIVEEWKQERTNLDVIANPRVAKRYWAVDPDPAATTVVYYADAADAARRHPAVLERPVLDPADGNKPKGKVVLLTTRMDVDEERDESKRWNDYWAYDSTWFVSFPYLLARYLAGDTADANFNYPAGATVTLPLPRGRMTAETQLILTGPGVGGDDTRPKLGEKQTEIRFGRPRTDAAGNFALALEKDRAALWKDGFSTNVPAEESNLDKVPVETIEELVGKNRVFAVDRNSTLRDWLDVAVGQPVDLFPWLLLAVLALFVAEGLAANRFYRKPTVAG
jgi:hypothetical protein